jgi:hypothetical protein
MLAFLVCLGEHILELLPPEHFWLRWVTQFLC